MIEMIVLAILQGIAEFLPISSSGHLTIADILIGGASEETLGMVLTLHAGTLLSVLVIYFHKIIEIFKKGNRGFLWYIVVASTPTAIIGLVIKYLGLDDALFSHLWLVGIGLLFTSFLLWFGLREHEGETEEDSNAIPASRMGFWRAIAIGIMQGVAIFPGVSRSGSTISTAVKLGVNRADAAAFSFLVSLPAIAGAVGLKALSTVKEMGGFSIVKQMPIEHFINAEYVVGFLVSAIVGILALKLLIKMLQKRMLQYFAIYTFFVGVFVLGMWGANTYRQWRIDVSGGVESLEIQKVIFVDSTEVDSKMKRIKKITLDSEAKK